MKAKIFLMLVVTGMALGISAAAQDVDAVMRFIGTDAAEEMDPYDVERMEDLLARPLKLNYVSEKKMEESGLFSRYQIASLSDYRSRHGDVLSLGELAAVDGFGHDFVSRLAPFISLESGRLPGTPASSRVHHDMSIRSSLRPGSIPTYGAKYRISAGERLTAGLSVSRTSDGADAAPDAYSGHLAFHLRRHQGKILIGDFNARFGQGLALWNGMGLSGLTSASSFMKKPSGISASSSFTGNYSLRGFAFDISARRLGIAFMTALAGSGGTFSVMPALNASYYMRNGRLSVTHYTDFSIGKPSVRIPDMKTSADAAFCIRGTDIFAEAVYDWVNTSFAWLAGVTVPAGEKVRVSGMLRYYLSSFSSGRSSAARSTTKCTNEYAVSLAADFMLGKWTGKTSADLAYFPQPKSSDTESMQLKAQTEWGWQASPSFKATVRLSERIRTWGQPFRTDVRTDFAFSRGRFLANLRLNALACRDVGLLSYMEGAYRGGCLSLYLRAGVFRIDNWDDRIYVYERDAPGSFNVPAYYGRGAWTAMTVNWRFAGWGRMYVRAAMTGYPFMEEKKPGRAELKIQFVFSL